MLNADHGDRTQVVDESKLFNDKVQVVCESNSDYFGDTINIPVEFYSDENFGTEVV